MALLVTVELGSNSGDINGNIVVHSGEYKSLIFKNDIICKVEKQLHTNLCLFGKNLFYFLFKNFY